MRGFAFYLFSHLSSLVSSSTMNQQLFNYVHNFAGKNPIFDGIGIFLATYLFYFLLLGFFLLVFFQDSSRRRWYVFCEGALTALLARGLITEAFHYFYHHPRPFDFYGFAPLVPESGWSFPSGHVTFLIALAMVIWFANKKWGVLYFLLTIVAGLARIYVGVHWPFDMAAGIVIGIVSGLIVHGLLGPSRRAIYRS